NSFGACRWSCCCVLLYFCFCFSFLFGHFYFLLLHCLDGFLTGNSDCRTLTSTSIGMGTLATNREALSMASSAVATEVDQTFDVQADLTAKIAFHFHHAIDDLAKLRNFGFGDRVGFLAQIDSSF